MKKGLHFKNSPMPFVFGEVQASVSLAPLTWFKVGGQAQWLFRPDSVQDLQSCVQTHGASFPINLLGAGSNVLVRSGVLPGITVILGKPFGFISRQSDAVLEVGAGGLDKKLSKEASDLGLSGLEFLYTIPGTIGGALRMNAGAFGRCMADVVTQVTALDSHGNIQVLSNADMGFSYRGCTVPKDWIFLGCRVQTEKKPQKDIVRMMQDLSQKRRESQPTGRTGGSTFKNPLGEGQKKAWQLLQESGAQSLQVGDAVFSDKHANFMINRGNATAQDLETLGEKARALVFEKTGVSLQWEIQRLGVHLGENVLKNTG